MDSSKFNGIVAIFNTSVGDAGAAGGVLAGPDDVNGTFLGHETGHLFGLSHSFDASARKNSTWSAPGEYFDEYDIMSAMACDGDSGHRFSPRGPLLNVAHLDRMGWLPASRVWHFPTGSSGEDTIDIVALEHPGVPGFLAAELGGVFVEFRMPHGWDAGIGHPCVLMHERRDPNTLILASDATTFNNEWQPGQTHGPPPVILSVDGGNRIEVISFNLPAKTARIRLRHVVTRIPLLVAGREFRGVREDGGGILILPNGKIVRIPPRSPVLILAEGATVISGGLQNLQPSVGGINQTAFQQGGGQ